MNSLVDQYQDRYFDPRRGQVIGVNYGLGGQAIETELGLGNGKRMSGNALGIGIDGLSDLLYREKPRQLTPGELNDFLGGMDPGDLFGGDVADGNVYLRQLLKFGEGGEPGRLYEEQEMRDRINIDTDYVAGNPSFDITGRSGDSRRKRRNLTPGDVNRLMNAYPDDAEKIRNMYLPGAVLPRV